MNKNLRFFTRSVVFFFVIAAFTGVCARAVFAEVFERRFSYFPDESLSVRVDGSRFSVENLPGAPEYDYGRIEFFTANGRRATEEWLSRSDGDSMGVDMARLPDGQYTVTFYHSNDRLSAYASYFADNDVQISVRDGEGSLITPIMYERNEAFRDAARMDAAALSACLEPTYGMQSDDPVIRSLAAGLTDGLTDDYEKAGAIHDWVAENIWYDGDAARTGDYGDNSALGALRLGRAVCDGYAKHNTALLRAAGVPTKFIYGYALGVDGDEWPSENLPLGNSNHSWNEAFINGRWVIIDVTWDSGNRYEHGRKVENGGLENRRYFDAAPEAFAAKHAITDPDRDLWWLPAAVPVPATPFTGGVLVDGVPASPAAYNIDGRSYIRLRDLAATLMGGGFGFAVDWDAASKTVSISTGGVYAADGTEFAGVPESKGMAARPDTVFMIDGEAVYLDVYNIGGGNYVKLRDMGEAVGFSVDYDASAGTVLIGAGGAAPASEGERGDVF
jgi:transglutaminase-like putative cysteine protease